MPEQIPPPPPSSPTNPLGQPAAPVNETEAKPLPHMGEEFGTAKKNLPPAGIVLIGVAAVLVVGAMVVYLARPTGSATGSIDNIVMVPVPDQNSLMVAVSVSFKNNGTRNFY